MPFLAQKQLPIPNKDLLSWMFDEPKYDVDMPIYIDAVNPTRTISSRQGRVLVRKLVAGLRAAGLQKGDCVCVHSFNDICYSILFLGIVAAGGVFTGTNPVYTSFELAHHIKTSRAKFIITEPELLQAIQVAARECDVARSNFRIFNILGQAVPQGYIPWSELLHHGEQDWVRFDEQELSSTTPAALLFSSGTTGLPKAALISHYNLVAQHTLAIAPDAPPWKIRRIFYMPMFHAAIVPVGHTTPFKAGHPSYVMRRFDLEIFLQSISHFKITDISVNPPVVLMALASPLLRQYDLTSVKWCKSGTAALGKVHQYEFEKHLASDAAFNQVWGMTETTCVASTFRPPENDTTGSIGRFIPNLDLKIIDEKGNDITAMGAKGELLVRGPTVIRGYYENPVANQAAFDDEGYFRTGDIISCEGFGESERVEGGANDISRGITNPLETAKWYMHDRMKELIKVRGFQVSPTELEKVILQHPLVVDAAVIGIPVYPASSRGSDSGGRLDVDAHQNDGEHPRAYVVLEPDGIVTEKEIQKWCSERLAKYKALTGGVRFVSTVPRNASGKLLKRLLREQVDQEGRVRAPEQMVWKVGGADMETESLKAKI